MNNDLLNAFREQDMDIIVEELTPLFYKHMKGIPEETRQDVFQELVLICIEVVKKYDFSQQHEFL